MVRLMYTSGTTSRPKGVMITYGNLYGEEHRAIVELGMTASDRGLACGPLYHVGALDMTTTNMLYLGGAHAHPAPVRRRRRARRDRAAQRSRNVWLAPAMVNAARRSAGDRRPAT